MNKLTIIPANLLVAVLIFTSCSKDEGGDKEFKPVPAPKCELTILGEDKFTYGDTITVDAVVTELKVRLKETMLYVDDKLVHSSSEKEFTHEVETKGLSVGAHTIKFTALDTRDSLGIAEKTFNLEAGEPVITNTGVWKLGADSATFYGELKSTGGLASTWGLCYNTTGNPQKEDKSIEVSDSIFAAKLTGLSKTTTYYARSWISNEKGTSYGKEIEFKTSDETGVFFDARDNHKYRWVKIGNQVWMAENLAYLPFLTDPTVQAEKDSNIYVRNYFGVNIEEARQTENYKTYGALYSWKMATELCPSGWHLPDTNEWNELVDFLGGKEIAGGKLKERGTFHWLEPNLGATDEVGFGALPSGSYIFGWKFSHEGRYFENWSRNEHSDLKASYYSISSDKGNVEFHAIINKFASTSVRCIKD